MRKYAQHFIFWRRAIAIPPLHARDIYILSPNCDVTKLPQATTEWAKIFPFAPPLPDFLASLSAAPRPYKLSCPTKSYRPDYLRMLAWLMRGGWVCQLCTFAYVVVWPEVLYEVEYALEADELASAKRAQQAAIDELETGPQSYGGSSATGSSSSTSAGDEGMGSSTSTLREGSGSGTGSRQLRRPGRSAEDNGGDDDDDDDDDDEHSSLSTSHASSSTPSSSFKDPATGAAAPHQHHQPTPAELAAEHARLERIAEKAARELAEKATAHARKTLPTQTDHPSINEAPHLAHLVPHIILDANKPTGKESLYLSAIARRLRARRSAPPVSKKAAAATSKTTSTTAASAAAAASTSAAAAAMTGAPGTPLRDRDRERARGDMAAAWAARVADTWPLFWKYFNGRSALERVALMEEMKRKDVWNLLTAMSEYLLCVRHW